MVILFIVLMPLTELDLFVSLCNELFTKYRLLPSSRMSIFEKVGMFLHILALRISNRVVGERFQHSDDTVSRVFHKVLNTISAREFKGLACDIIRPRDSRFKYMPVYFKVKIYY